MRLIALPLAASLAASLALSAGAATAAVGAPRTVIDSVEANLKRESVVLVEDGESVPASLTTAPARMFSKVDINGDGKPDWRVDYEHAPNASLWCGTGGCRNELWVSGAGDSYRRVMSVGLRLFKLTRRAGVARLDLDFHGSLCGGYGVQACPRSYLWNEQAGAFVETAAPGNQTWLAGGPHPLEPLELAREVPAPVRAAVEAASAQCAAVGARFEADWAVTSLPDIDGDGARDWIVGSGYMDCEYETDRPDNGPELSAQVYLTGGAPGSPRLALARQNLRYGIDIGSTPAAFHLIEAEAPCEYEKSCGRRLAYDPATGHLTD
jgi:hypothetical protein